MSYPFRFYAVVIPGLEPIAAAELAELSAHEIDVEEGGVAFSGTMETMFRINLRSRTITRVLLRLKRFTALTLDEFVKHASTLDWGRYLTPESGVTTHASCRASRLNHSGRVEEAIGALLEGSGYRRSDENNLQSVHIRIDNNRCRISIDTSGERLDRRGWRLEGGKAPVRESLAAAVLRWMEWSYDEPLMVPMCGSGTFAIEAATMGLKMAPGLSHAFPFLHWPSVKEKAWKRMSEKSGAMKGYDNALQITASDINPEAVAIAGRNVERAGVEKAIVFEQKDARKLARPEGQAGVLVLNPPYGRRIDTNVARLYADLSRIYRDEFAGWRAAIFSPDRDCEKALNLPVRKRLRVRHGGRWIDILHV